MIRRDQMSLIRIARVNLRILDTGKELLDRDVGSWRIHDSIHVSRMACH